VQAALMYLQKHEPFTVDSRASADRSATPDQLAKAAVELHAEWTSPTELRLHVKILEGFHLNANRAAQGMIPTTFTLADVPATIEYPPGESSKFAFATEPIRVYEGTVTILARLEKALPSGTKLRGGLTYQPCTENACLSATSKSIDLATP
jgi:hypothetical protein